MPGTRDRVEIYTDGGCDPNPGPGGWGAILVSGDRTKEISGAEAHTTNNRMELTAAIRALALLKRPCDITLFTDSTYLRDGITRWSAQWKARGWRKADGSPVENMDLWQSLQSAQEQHTVDWRWIRGHRGHRWNERADELATNARRALAAEDEGSARLDAVVASQASRRGEPRYDIYARGCALGNPGPGGYGAIIVRAERSVQRSGGWPVASSNVMDLWAIISALQSLPEPSHVVIHTPSKYVIDGASRWLPIWERSGWRTQAGLPVKNRVLWEELSQVMGDHDIEWHHLAAAQSTTESEAALALAREEASAQKAASAQN